MAIKPSSRRLDSLYPMAVIAATSWVVDMSVISYSSRVPHALNELSEINCPLLFQDEIVEPAGVGRRQPVLYQRVMRRTDGSGTSQNGTGIFKLVRDGTEWDEMRQNETCGNA